MTDFIHDNIWVLLFLLVLIGNLIRPGSLKALMAFYIYAFSVPFGCILWMFTTVWSHIICSQLTFFRIHFKEAKKLDLAVKYGLVLNAQLEEKIAEVEKIKAELERKS